MVAETNPRITMPQARDLAIDVGRVGRHTCGMEKAESEKILVRVGVGIPPEADIVFVPSDKDGIGSDVIAEFFPGLSTYPDNSGRLADQGFALEHNGLNERLVFFSVRSGKHPLDQMMGQRVRAALLELEKELPGRSVWMPIIAESALNLGLAECAQALAEGIAEYLEVTGAPAPREIRVALPIFSDDGAARVVVAIFHKMLGHRADVQVDERFLRAPSRYRADDDLLGTGESVEDAFIESLEESGSPVPDFSKGDKPDPPPPPSPPPDPLRTTAPFQPDTAATVDRLNRAAVAKTLGTLIDDVWKDPPGQGDASFMIHLHGRWGSGKTSILNFLKEELSSGDIAALRPKRKPPWLIVDYNAWRNQGLGPAWWTVLNAVYDTAVDKLRPSPDGSRWRVRFSHLLWRMKIAWVPTAITAIVTLVAAYVVLFVDLQEGWQDTLKNATALATFLGTVFLLRGESGIVNSQTAKRYVELARDPIGPLTGRYEQMIGEIDRPVAVIIDDLDRCDAEFVVELLQTVQTLYRGARVLYVVAADRDWLCRSYEKIYADFSDAVAEPGRSLGHLFVEKVFQLSVEVPPLLDHQRDRFWNELIRQSPETSPEDREKIEVEVAEQIDALDTESDLIEFVQSQRSDAVRASIVGAQAFRRMQSAPLQREREHFLSDYATLLEPNPRAMKRLLNAYGFRRGFDIQSLTPSNPDALARWTILENRWPILADHLSGRSSGTENAETITRLLEDDEVRRVAGGLTWDALRPVPGAPGEDSAEAG